MHIISNSIWRPTIANLDDERIAVQTRNDSMGCGYYRHTGALARFSAARLRPGHSQLQSTDCDRICRNGPSVIFSHLLAKRITGVVFAMSFLHSRGAIHPNLKLENILPGGWTLNTALRSRSTADLSWSTPALAFV